MLEHCLSFGMVVGGRRRVGGGNHTSHQEYDIHFPASTGLPPDCDLDGGVSETDCVDPNPNPSEPLTATCFCSGSDDVIIIFNGRWPDPQCGGWSDVLES